jgi:hypothetical protein
MVYCFSFIFVIICVVCVIMCLKMFLNTQATGNHESVTETTPNYVLWEEDATGEASPPY